MEGHAHLVISWLFSNTIAVLVGGFLGYRFGDTVRGWLDAAYEKILG